MYTVSGVFPPNTQAGLKRAGVSVDNYFRPGFVLYGIPIGDPRFVKHHLGLKVKDISKQVDEFLEVLQDEGPVIWTVLKSSIVMKMDYQLAFCIIEINNIYF